MTALEHHTFGGSAMDRYLFDFETVADAPAGDAVGSDQSSAPADAADTGQAGAPADAGAAAAATEAPAAPSAPIPAPVDWSSPEAQAQINAAIEAREQAAIQQQQDAAAREAQASEFDDIREAFEMLGIPADRFNQFLDARLGQTVQPFQQMAQRQQEAEALQWVDQALVQLGTSHPELLGEGVDKLADLKDDQGQPLFNADEVRQHNREAVLYAAAGLQQAQGLDHGQALQQGAQAVANRDALIGKAAVQRYIRQLEGASHAPSDVSGGGATGAARLTGVEGGDELSIARRWAAENIR